jgi:hypothetical protein
MKSTRTLRFSLQRLFLLTLVSFVAVAAVLGIAASANKANRAAKARAEQAANTKSGIDPALQNDKQPNAPTAAAIVATLTDNVTAATKVAPGATINYTATITNNGAASPADDATNLNYSGPLDANTTLVPGSVHASPIALNDTYNWVGNTLLDTNARALPAITANDIAVNATGGTDTFTVTAIAGGPTALGGAVTVASPSGAFTYTPPLGRPNLADGATVQDSFTYTITNSADPSLTSTGTVRINLTGRVWYLQAGAAGDGRSNTPSSSPVAMSTAADKSTDVFYIFSNAASLNGPFSVDAGQQLLGQGVNLVVSAITLFNSAAPTPTTTNTAGSCVALAGAPGNNTLSGFNIGNCTSGTAITGANVGTLNVSTLSINTNGGGLDLTGVGTPTVSVVLGGLTTTGGAKSVNLVGLNGTITLASGALSGASGNTFDVSGGTATISYSGTVTNTAAARLVNVASKTGGSLSLSGALSGTGSSTGVNLTNNAGATLNFTGGITLSTAGNAAFTATGGGPAATTGGTINVTQNNTTIVNTLTTTTGIALNVANTTIGASGLTFRSISANGASNGIIVNNTGSTGSFIITGNGGACTSAGTCSGGAIQNSTADGVVITSTLSPSLTRLNITDSAGAAADDGLVMTDISGTVTVDTCSIINSPHNGFTVDNNNTNMAGFNLTNTAISCASGQPCQPSGSIGNDGLSMTIRGTSVLTSGLVTGSTFSGHRAVGVQVQANDSGRIGSNSGGAITAPAASNSITVQTNTFTGNGQGVDIDEAQIANISFQILTNTIVGKLTAPGAVSSQSSAVAINAFTSAGAATGPTVHTFVGKIDGNIIGTQGVKDSGAGFGSGIRAVVQGSATQGVVAITNNTIRETPNADIITAIGQNGAAASPSATARFRITGNNLPQPSGSNLSLCGPVNTACAGNGIFVLADEGSPVCNVITGNTVFDLSTMNGTAGVYLAERAGPPAGSQLTVEGTGSVSAFIQANNTLAGALKFIDEGGNTSLVGTGACGGFPAATTPAIELSRVDHSNSRPAAIATNAAKAPVVPAATVQPVSSKDGMASVLAKATPKATAAEVARIYQSERPISHHAVRRYLDGSAQQPNAPASGETVTLNAIATFPAAGKSITIKYSATVNTPPLARQVSTQGTVTAAGGISVLTDDPEPAGAANPTVTLVDTLITWNGSTSTDWNTATNWTPPAGGTQYAPGVSNPAVNDVVIPNVGAQPAISATDITVFSLSLANGRTLTITNPRILTVGGAPGGDLTLDGIISGGNLNMGTGTHVINNAGGTGSLSADNVMTVLSGSTTTLNNNLQAGAVAVNGGGSLNITNRTLSLNGAGAALTVTGGGTFTTTGSTVVFNGTAAQQAAGTIYNNLTINNTIGAHVTGVTLTGNATVNGVLTLTSSDLDTGANTLTMPAAASSAPASGATDVVGNVKRTGFVSGGAALSFGNPLNTIRINVGTAPTDINVLLAKNAPATYTTAVLRSYTITPTGGSGITATVRLHYRQVELNGNLETPAVNFNLRRKNTVTGQWQAVVPTTRNTGVPEDNWLESAAVTGFSEWTFASLAPTAAGGVVTGRIVDDHGNAVEGAVVRLSGAQNRKFITDANGFYRFDNVEANGFYTVTPSRANYSFNPAVRSFSQIGETTEAGFGATLATSNLANPLDTPEYFVRQHYIDFLGREPDEAGFNFWSDQILECGGDSDCVQRRRENVSAAYFLSIEFQQTGGLVDGLYRASYGVGPQYAAFMPDTRMIGAGVRVGDEGWEATLRRNKEAFVNAFVNRAAFHQVYDSMNDNLFVDTLISHTGVSFTAAERDELVGSLGTGQMTRAEVLRSIAENSRFVDAKRNEMFVMMEYMGYLRRDPDASGYAFWLNKLNQFNGNFEQAEMVKAFIVSGEFRDRFPR